MNLEPYKDKRVLLIAGGGTLGTYVAKELLEKGAYVDVICLEDKVSDCDRLKYIKARATLGMLESLFSKTRYDGIVNFIHYVTAEDYEPYHELLVKNTEHLIFLSSYRVYADMQHPITESAPRLLDVSEDEQFLKTEDYALPKARCEDMLFSKHRGEHFTVVRPVISFSCLRFDLFVYSDNDIFDCISNGQVLGLPCSAKQLVAGIDWAGNSGKLIANLLFKRETYGEVYTVSSAQNLTWGEVADIYSKLTGLKVEWCAEEEFELSYPCLADKKKYLYIYDRKFDRQINNEKILAATGLTKKDFASIEEGLAAELKRREALCEK